MNGSSQNFSFKMDTQESTTSFLFPCLLLLLKWSNFFKYIHGLYEKNSEMRVVTKEHA